MNRLGSKILRAIKGQEIMAIKERHRFQRLAALELPKDALEYRAEPLGGDGVKYGASKSMPKVSPLFGSTFMP